MSDYNEQSSFLSSFRGIGTILAGLAVAAAAVCSPMIVENVDSDELVVIQSPISGKLTWYTTPGWAFQGLGTVTSYKRVYNVGFKEEGINPTTKRQTGGLDMRFSDGGHGTMFGSVSFKMPEDPQKLNAIHMNFRGSESVQSGLLRTVLNKSVYLTGTLMTSKESYAEKRNELIHYVTDQMQYGIYRTRQDTKWIKDEMTQQSKQVVLAEIVHDKDGKTERQEDSVLNQYGIQAFNFTIDKLPYDDRIEKQITDQQSLTMAVQTKIAEVKQAEQEAILAKADGEAKATRTKWEQEAIKAREVTKALQEQEVAVTNANKEKIVAETAAQRQLTVAELEKRAAAETKQKDILLGEGEAKRKELVLAADGALQKKGEIYIAVQQAWATAFANSKNPLVPSIVMGGAPGAGQQNAAQDLMNLLTVKTAKDLNLDLSIGNVKK